LPSELDQNFHLRAGDGEEYVLRIVRSEADPAFVEAQVEVLRYLADPLSRVRAGGSRRTDQAGLSTPEVVLSLDGAAIETARLDAENHRVWLVRFLRGKPLAKARPHRPELLKSVGRALGELDLRLAAFSHAAVHRDLCWDLRNAPAVRPLLEHVEDPSRRKLVTTRLDRAEDQVLPRLRETRAQVIHNDANDYNILVDTSGTALTGILDFARAFAR
jgi:Ser/Thr protein kinase RdoA (MazF antagonist)